MREGRWKKVRGNGFRIGDMVWAKVKPHPWWPGVIFNEAFASPSVFNTKIEGYLLVAFFGDATYQRFDPVVLVSFGSHYVNKLKQTRARSFLVAVEEAVAEISRRAALGLACLCRNPSNFQSTNVQGFLKVDVSGYQPGGLYSTDQIKRAREDFHPLETLSFAQQLALSPRFDVQRDVNFMKNVAKVLDYLKAVFNEFDETYAQAFGVQPGGYGNSLVVSHKQEEVMTQASLDGKPTSSKSPGESEGFAENMKVRPNISKQRDVAKLSRSRYCNKSSEDPPSAERMETKKLTNYLKGSLKEPETLTEESVSESADASASRKRIVEESLIQNCNKVLPSSSSLFCHFIYA